MAFRSLEKVELWEVISDIFTLGFVVKIKNYKQNALGDFQVR